MQEMQIQPVGQEDPWKRKWLPTILVQERRRLGGYSPWDCKESDMTKQLNNNTHLNRGRGEEYGILAAAAKSLQSCPSLCYPIDGHPPGSAFPGILQARTLKWVVIDSYN